MMHKGVTAPHLPVFLGSPKPVLPIGLGLAAIGRPGYINLGHANDIKYAKDVQGMRQQSFEVLDAAYESGVRYFDAARSYGKAEDFLSSWLADRKIQPNQDVLVGSKWGYTYTANFQVDTGGQPHEIKDHSQATLAQQSDISQSLLGDHLNLYQIHSATLESGVLEKPDVLQYLERLKQERGWRIGLSLSGSKQADTLRVALKVRTSGGKQLFSSVQATWNLLEQAAGDALCEAKDADWDVIIKEGMANGRLAGQNPDPAFAEKQATLQDHATSLSTTVDALALAAIIAQPFKPMVLSGAATPSHIRSNMKAVELSTRLDLEQLKSLQSSLVQDSEAYWSERSRLEWN